VRDAELLEQEYEPREEMRDLEQHLGGEIGTARVLFSPARARYEREGRRDVTMLRDGSPLAAVSYGSLSWLGPEILKNRAAALLRSPCAVGRRFIVTLVRTVCALAVFLVAASIRPSPAAADARPTGPLAPASGALLGAYVNTQHNTTVTGFQNDLLAFESD